jgi:hypothetical protein
MPLSAEAPAEFWSRTAEGGDAVGAHVRGAARGGLLIRRLDAAAASGAAAAGAGAAAALPALNTLLRPASIRGDVAIRDVTFA